MINHGRNGLIETLKEMNGKIKIYNERIIDGEKTASIYVEYSELKGIIVPSDRAPQMIDEYPILSIAAAAAEGKTTRQ